MNKKDSVEIIVAHYNENIDWLKPYADKVIIYHKGNDKGPKFPVKKWIKLPNIGREAHTYLYHIVNNYDNLAEYTLFFQGGIKDHLEAGDVYKSIDDYLYEIEKCGFSCAKLFFLIRKNPQIVYVGKFAEMLKKGLLIKSKYTFADFYNKLLNKKQSYLTPCFWAANFGVSSKLIKKRGLLFYKKALNLIPDNSNPEEAHFYERLWFSIFNKSYNFHTLWKLFSFYFGLFKKKFLKNF